MQTSSSITPFVVLGVFAAGCETSDSRGTHQAGSSLADEHQFSYHDAIFTPGCGIGDKYAFFISLSGGHDPSSCQPIFETPTVRIAVTLDYPAHIVPPATYVLPTADGGSFGQYVANGLPSNELAVSGSVTLTSYQQNTGAQGNFSLVFADNSTLSGDFTAPMCLTSTPYPCGGTH